MRIGDLDALKDYAFEVYQGNGVELETLMVVPLREIDNAPTVSLDMAQVLAYENGKASAERPQGEWIPVSERLPDVGQVVIVTDDRGEVFEYELNPLNVDKYTTGKWRFLEHEIIAWQPLPDPYMKGGV